MRIPNSIPFQPRLMKCCPAAFIDVLVKDRSSSNQELPTRTSSSVGSSRSPKQPSPGKSPRKSRSRFRPDTTSDSGTVASAVTEQATPPASSISPLILQVNGDLTFFICCRVPYLYLTFVNTVYRYLPT